MQEHSPSSPTAPEDTLGAVLQQLVSDDPSLAARFEDAGLEVSQIEDIRQLDQLPVQSKDELVAARVEQSQHWTPRRIFQSPGPIYEAQPPGDDPWRWAQALRSVGLQPADVVINCFGYHLSPAGAMFDEAIIAAGATVLPGGTGSQQLKSRRFRIWASGDMRAYRVISKPSLMSPLTRG